MAKDWKGAAKYSLSFAIQAGEKEMEILPIFFGVLIALAIFLHLLSKYHQFEDKQKLDNADIEIKHQDDDITPPKRPDELRKRFCPLCGAELKPYDSLYAEMYEGNPRPRVIIHGCRYCYMPSGKKIEIKKTENQEKKDG